MTAAMSDYFGGGAENEASCSLLHLPGQLPASNAAWRRRRQVLSLMVCCGVEQLDCLAVCSSLSRMALSLVHLISLTAVAKFLFGDRFSSWPTAACRSCFTRCTACPSLQFQVSFVVDLVPLLVKMQF